MAWLQQIVQGLISDITVPLAGVVVSPAFMLLHFELYTVDNSYFYARSRFCCLVHLLVT